MVFSAQTIVPLRDCFAVSAIITLTLLKHAYSNILKVSPPKTENFQTKKTSDIIHISARNIDCGYSFELPQ